MFEQPTNKNSKLVCLVKSIVILVLVCTFCLTFLIWIVNISKFTGSLAEVSGKLEKAYNSENIRDQNIQYKLENISTIMEAKMNIFSNDINSNLEAVKTSLKEIQKNNKKGKSIYQNKNISNLLYSFDLYSTDYF